MERRLTIDESIQKLMEMRAKTEQLAGEVQDHQALGFHQELAPAIQLLYAAHSELGVLLDAYQQRKQVQQYNQEIDKRNQGTPQEGAFYEPGNLL